MTATFAVFALMRAAGRLPHRQHLRPRAARGGPGDLLELTVSASAGMAAAERRRQDRSHVPGRRAAGVSAAHGISLHLRAHQARAALNLPISRLWPHAWPIWIQAVLMVLVVDLLRYWLHRASHENDTLWRLHSVHHSVEQLYWLNTARFHPIEKALQMSLDSLPFLLMARGREGARALLRGLCDQRLLSALQHRRFTTAP